MARRSATQKEAEKVEKEEDKQSETSFDTAADSCCSRHPECDAKKCVCFTKCHAAICECDNPDGRSHK